MLSQSDYSIRSSCLTCKVVRFLYDPCLWSNARDMLQNRFYSVCFYLVVAISSISHEHHDQIRIYPYLHRHVYTQKTHMPLNKSILLLAIIHSTPINNYIYLMFKNRLVTSINILTSIKTDILIVILQLTFHIKNISMIILQSSTCPGRAQNRNMVYMRALVCIWQFQV